jgi:hypothetical protein
MDKTNAEIMDQIKGWLGNYEASCLLNVLKYGDATTTHLNITGRLRELGVDKWVYDRKDKSTTCTKGG